MWIYANEFWWTLAKYLFVVLCAEQQWSVLLRLGVYQASAAATTVCSDITAGWWWSALVLLISSAWLSALAQPGLSVENTPLVLVDGLKASSSVTSMMTDVSLDDWVDLLRSRDQNLLPLYSSASAADCRRFAIVFHSVMPGKHYKFCLAMCRIHLGILHCCGFSLFIAKCFYIVVCFAAGFLTHGWSRCAEMQKPHADH